MKVINHNISRGLLYFFVLLTVLLSCAQQRAQIIVHACGDGQRQGQESCDGDDLNGKTCQLLGMGEGILRCAADCSFDSSGCNALNIADSGLDDISSPSDVYFSVDGANPDVSGSDRFSSLPDGSLHDHPTSDLALGDSMSTTGDSVAGLRCGDDSRQGSETCDGLDLAGQSCTDLTYYNEHKERDFAFTGGQLACQADCSNFDTRQCTKGEVGDPCQSAGQCPTLSGWIHLHNARCLQTLSSGQNMTEGYCTATCEEDYAYCCRLGGGICVLLSAEYGAERICLKACVNAADCRSGYTCAEQNGGRYCLPQP